jgi:hypothetical protein
MTTYRFKARVSKKGIIRVPVGSHLLDKDVEVVLVKHDDGSSKDVSAASFIDKWAGFLPDTDPGDARYNYLAEKYK